MTDMTNQTYTEKLDALIAGYAWPGGYPLFGLMRDGEPMCRKCAAKERKLILDAEHDKYDKQWGLSEVGVNWEENDMICCHCNEQIESAYGEGK